MKLYSPTLVAAVTLALGLGFPSRGFADQHHTLNATDSQFVKSAASDGMAELQLAELGVRKAARANVRNFAESLVKEHMIVNAEVRNLAKAKGIDDSAAIARNSATDIRDLDRKLSAHHFDTAFLKQVQLDHQNTISTFENESKNARDGMVKSFVAKTLPTLESHRDQAGRLLGK